MSTRQKPAGGAQRRGSQKAPFARRVKKAVVARIGKEHSVPSRALAHASSGARDQLRHVVHRRSRTQTHQVFRRAFRPCWRFFVWKPADMVRIDRCQVVVERGERRPVDIVGRAEVRRRSQVGPGSRGVMDDPGGVGRVCARRGRLRRRAAAPVIVEEWHHGHDLAVVDDQDPQDLVTDADVADTRVASGKWGTRRPADTGERRKDPVCFRGAKGATGR